MFKRLDTTIWYKIRDIYFLQKEIFFAMFFPKTSKIWEIIYKESIGQRTHRGPIDLLSLAECKKKC